MRENMKQDLIPKPRSKFLLVRCKECSNEVIVYSHTTKNIHCKSCNNLLVEKSGGYAIINAEIVKRVDNP